MKKDSFKDFAWFVAFACGAFAVSVLITPEAKAETINPPYVVWNATQIEQNGHSFQIEGIKPTAGKTGEGMAWLADTADLKAQARPHGGEFVTVGCREVLLNRHLCKDIHFADGDSVKEAVLKRRYAEKK